MPNLPVMMTKLEQTDTASPPEGLTPPQAALWWLKKGELKMGASWEEDHMICQSNEGEPAHDLVHALCHLIEGDRWNADYWYQRAGAAKQSDDPAAEWLWMAARLTA